MGTVEKGVDGAKFAFLTLREINGACVGLQEEVSRFGGFICFVRGSGILEVEQGIKAGFA